MDNIQLEGGNAIRDWLLGRTETEFDDSKTDPTWSGEKRGGSANLDMVANAAALILAKGSDVAFWVAAWLAFFEANRRAFQRSEPWSVIYTGWHLVSVLVVYLWAKRKGEAALLLAAAEWLENLWALFALAGASHGGKPFSVLTGARSSGVPIGAWYGHRAFWCEALGVSWPDRGRQTDERNGWLNVAIPLLKEAIDDTAAKVVARYAEGDWKGIAALAPGLGMRGTGNIYRTPEGVVAWVENDVNGNTAGVLACRASGGTVETLPPGGGPHFRSAHSRATCTRDGGWLHYVSPHAELGAHSLALPHGEPLYHLRITEDGWEWLAGGPERPAEPSIPPGQGVGPLPGGSGRKGARRRSNSRRNTALGVLALILGASLAEKLLGRPDSKGGKP